MIEQLADKFVQMPGTGDSNGKENGEEDEVYGDFEDLETGETVEGNNAKEGLL
jgi:ribosome biogenesis protein BMS1